MGETSLGVAAKVKTSVRKEMIDRKVRKLARD